MRSSVPSRIAWRRISSAAVAQRGVRRSEHADVVTGRDAVGLDGEPVDRLLAALGEHVVEQDAIDPAEHQIRVRVHVVVVGHRRDAVLALGPQQDLVGDGPAERGHPAAGEILEGAEGVAVGVANARAPR